jgi:hypothetical protein
MHEFYFGVSKVAKVGSCKLLQGGAGLLGLAIPDAGLRARARPDLLVRWGLSLSVGVLNSNCQDNRRQHRSREAERDPAADLTAVERGQ